MQPLILYRCAALITLALVAGAAHSFVLGAGGKRITLKPEAPTPINLPGLSQPTTNPVAPADQPEPTGVAHGQPEAAPAPPAPPTDPMDQLNITIEQARALFDQNVIFIDARPLHEYEAGHVPNAFYLTTETYHTPEGLEVLEFLDPSAPMVIYCNGGACDASKNLVILLQQSGYMGGRIMHDGYPAWAAAGHPTATGKPIIGGPKE
jgi:rhodanese-related sulfurtransferase